MTGDEILKPVVGQAEAASILARFLGQAELPSSYLFHGPEGVGKFLAARLFCAELVRAAIPAEESMFGVPEEPGPSGPPEDLTILDKGRDRIKIEEIQGLIQRMNLKPFRSRRKAFVINNAENMTKEAANCLLKTLEEPPAGSFLVLITKNASALLATIRSRCIKIRFHRLTEETVERLLVSVRDLGPEAARQISLLSEGSMSAALELADTESYAELRKLFDRAVGIWERTSPGFERAIIDLAAEFDRPDEREKLLFPKLLDIFTLYWRDAMTAGFGSRGIKTILGLPRYAAVTAAQARRVIGLIASVRDDLANNANLRMALEYVLLESGRLLSPAGESHVAVGRN